MILLLCGPPCSGKSTIARLTSARLGWEEVDIDEKIREGYAHETGENKTCGEIYKLEGEEGFRDLEKKVLLNLPSMEKVVIALGGGVLERLPGLDGAVFVYLRASEESLWSRVLSRPKLPAYLPRKNPKEAFIRRILPRLSKYEAMADFTIDTNDLAPEDVVSRICSFTHDKEETHHGLK